jgi:BirA family biotin operon repressor/biotin-[acetyl-CoA-carboxylase] ligase
MTKFRDRGTERARELRNGSTPAERCLWRYLRNKQLGARFNRQLKIGAFFPDFLCRELKLIVEVDGFSHDVQPERDVWRDRLLAKAGYRVLHFSNEDVLGNVEGVVAAIRLEIAALTLP